MHGKGRKNTIWTVLLLSALTVFGVMLNGFDGRAAKEEDTGPVLKVVLVGYDSAGYITTGEDGKTGGYYAECLNELARYNNWSYDITILQTEEELLAAVEKGDYDLLLGVNYTSSDDEAYFDYPSVSLGNRKYVLATTKTHPELEKDDISTLQGITVGVAATPNNIKIQEMFQSFCVSNGIEYALDGEPYLEKGINFRTVGEQERFALLADGQLDAVITTDSKALENNLYVVNVFGQLPFYAVVPNGKEDILKSVEDALGSIKRQDTEFEQRLYQDFFSQNDVNELAFTQAEQQVLKWGYQYKVALWDDCAPYSYLNRDGEWCGVAVEVFNEISRMTDNRLRFSFVEYADSFAANDALKSGEADIIGQTFTSINALERGNNRSKSYYSDAFRMYCNASAYESLDTARVVIKQDVPDELLTQLGVSDCDSVIRVETVVDALKMVNDGRADVTFALQSVGDYYTSYYQLSMLQDYAVHMEGVSFCAVYSDGMSETAKIICNRCIAYLDRDMLSRRITEYILTDHKPVSLKDYVDENLSTFAIVVISVLVVTITLLGIIIITINRNSRRIRRMLYQDDITEGISYLKFEEEVAKLVMEKPGAYDILFADIHNFKYINDVFGYAMGNRVLCAVEQFIRSLTDGCFYARMYSDHFVGIRPTEDKERLKELLDKEIETFSKMCRNEFPEFNVFLKIGIYTWKGRTLQEIRQYVNLANYAADNLTNLSGTAYCFYTTQMHDRILSRQEIERDMHRALAEKEFVAYYQPKYDILTNEIVGAEALVRWQHKTKGLIPPGRFVPVFEQDGFIAEIDFCIMEQVCDFLARRMAAGQKLYPISCNFSRIHFQKEEFIPRLREVLKQYGVPPQYVEIEITETVATNDGDFARLVETVKRLKDIGFLISIDDFGSGYSCIQLLYKLPIDVLKLDRVFVVAQDTNKKEEDINRSIIRICHSHDIKIICEGVETEEQKEFVHSYGCRFVQGFYYSKPVPQEQFEKMLTA